MLVKSFIFDLDDECFEFLWYVIQCFVRNLFLIVQNVALVIVSDDGLVGLELIREKEVKCKKKDTSQNYYS